MTAVNGLKALFDKFEALAGDSAAMWEFYSAQPAAIKMILWSNFPQFHARLREEEKKELL